MQNNIASLNNYLRQFLSAVFGFCQKSGVVFVTGCAALAVSRVCQVVAFFLPLKIFIMINSSEVPEYFRFVPSSMEFQDVIVLLALSVPIVYGLFITLGIIYRRLIDFHLARFNSSVLFVCGLEMSNKKMRKLHNHLSKAFSEAGLVVVSVLFALILDPMVAVSWLVLLYVNLLFFNFKAFYAEDQHRLTFLQLHRRQFIEYISSANFLIVFAVLAFQLVYFGMGVYSAIFLLLVSRMVFQALNRFSIESLYILKLLP